MAHYDIALKRNYEIISIQFNSVGVIFSIFSVEVVHLAKFSSSFLPLNNKLSLSKKEEEGPGVKISKSNAYDFYNAEKTYQNVKTLARKKEGLTKN